MTHSSRTGTNYWTRVKAGHCGKCGRERGPNGTTRLCGRCADRAAKKMARRRARFKSQNKCTECGVRTKPGDLLCRLHKLERAVRNEQYRARRRPSVT